MAQYREMHAEWAPNEKVALETAMGASFGGVRALVVMKHVGVNVAADPLFTLSYTGLRGGLVLVTADDPEMHSSQNEQDNRNYAKFAKVPMLEPSDSQEAKDFTLAAFEISERFDTPVMLRTTTRVSHSKSIVVLEEPKAPPVRPEIVKDPVKFVMLPANARKRHPVVEKRMKDLASFAETFPGNAAGSRTRCRHENEQAQPPCAHGPVPGARPPPDRGRTELSRAGGDEAHAEAFDRGPQLSG